MAMQPDEATVPDCINMIKPIDTAEFDIEPVSSHCCFKANDSSFMSFVSG